MGKRTDEKPFRPLEAALVTSVISRPRADEPHIQLVAPESAINESADRLRAGEEGLPMRLQSVSKEIRGGGRGELGQQRSEGRSILERMEREKRVLLTPSEEHAVEHVVRQIASELGTPVKLSHVLRSCVRLIVDAEEQLIERARSVGRTIRPPNGDRAAIERFERVIAHLLQAGLRAARPLR